MRVFTLSALCYGLQQLDTHLFWENQRQSNVWNHLLRSLVIVLSGIVIYWMHKVFKLKREF